MSGFISLGYTILRNNKRKRIDKLKRIERYIGAKNKEASYNKASETLLRNIRKQIQEEEQKTKRKTILIFVVVGIVLLSALYYFLFVHQFSGDVPLLFQF